MSRAYQVAWVTVQSTVTARDRLTLKLALLGILGAGEMAALLREELRREGWAPGALGTLVRTVEGMQATLSADATEVTVTGEDAATVDVRAMGKDAADMAVRTRGQDATARMTRDLKARLTAVEPDLRARLGDAVQRTYTEALRRKAASLGTVESVQETRGADGEVEVTIKVKT